MADSKAPWLAVALAVISYALAAILKRDEQTREARIARVQEQLGRLHGPLLATLSASKAAYDAMLSHVSPDGSRAALRAALKDASNASHAKTAAQYRHWLEHVFQPLNERASKVVENGFHLLDVDQDNGTSSIPINLLLELVAHTAHLRVILASYKGDLAPTVTAEAEATEPPGVSSDAGRDAFDAPMVTAEAEATEPPGVSSDAGRDAFDAATEKVASFIPPRPVGAALSELPGRYGAVSFPDGLVDHVEREFVRLTRVQARLLNIPPHEVAAGIAQPRARL